MNKGLKKLNDIGVQKIHETTHISKAHVNSILDKKFADLNSVQLSGFISILEREYEIDLGEVKNDAILYFNENTSDISQERKMKILSSSKKNSSFTLLYMGIAMAIIAIFLYLTLSTDNSNSKVVVVDNTTVKTNKIITTKDTNKDANKTEVVVLQEIKPLEEIEIPVVQKVEIIEKSSIVENIEKPKEIEKIQSIKEVENITEEEENKIESLSLKIIPKHEVWIGYIDLSTYKKYQKIFTDELILDSNKNWLFVFGHGYIDIEIDGDTQEFRNPKNVRFSYIDSQLKQITLSELKDLNKGNRW